MIHARVFANCPDCIAYLGGGLGGPNCNLHCCKLKVKPLVAFFPVVPNLYQTVSSDPWCVSNCGFCVPSHPRLCSGAKCKQAG